MKTLKTELIACFDQLDTYVHLSFLEMQRDCRKGTIHALRVALKRFRALLQMLDALDPHFAGKPAIKKLKPLFEEAGKLRALQILDAILHAQEEKLQMDHVHSAKIRQRIGAQQRFFDEFIHSYSIADIREASLQARSHLLHLGLRALRSGLRGYFRDLLQDISRLSREGLSSKKRLHDLRKNIKKVHYNLLVILETNPSLSLPAEPVQALENAQNLLGKWHDQHLAFREAKDMSDAPKLLLRQLRQEERLCLQEVRIALVQLPPQVECLLQEAEHMLAPKPTAC
ncbi:MAG: CHAD domain-containing protein [Saprospirales bacterium]|nr:CHAD domain-containing protein [Saprospirales bacterium]